MSYTLKLTNGKLLLTLPDQQSDKVATSLTLIGKNVNAYGTDINQNYIHILENFANSTAPRSPLVGQLWYDTNAQILKVYTKNNSFKTVGAPVISSEQPKQLGVGEFWYDTTAEQMKFKVDSSNIIVIGPEDNAIVGKSGWVTETIFDISNSSQTVVSLYSNNILMGILSEKEFVVRSDFVSTATSEITNIFPGFNPVDYYALRTKWNGTAKNAETLGGIAAEQYKRDALDQPFEISSASIVTIRPKVQIGPDNNFIFTPEDSVNGSANLFVGKQDQNFSLTVNSLENSFKGSALFIDGANNRVGFFTTTPQDDVNVKGNMRIDGNLTILGTSTYIDSRDLRVYDKDIYLGWDGVYNPSEGVAPSSSATDALINGGGISLVSSEGFGPKEIRYFSSAGDVSKVNSSWSITGNMDLRFIDSAYYIFDKKVLDYTSLGENIVSAPGLTEIGDLTSLNVGSLSFETNPATTSTDIKTRAGFEGYSLNIGDGNTTEISFKNAIKATAPYPGKGGEITDPLLIGEEIATVNYVESRITRETNPTLALSIDVTNHSDSLGDDKMDEFVMIMLTFLWDPNDPAVQYRAPNGARARVLCFKTQSIDIEDVPSKPFELGVPLEVDQDGIPRAVKAVKYSLNYVVKTTIPAKPLTVQRVVKEYIVVSGEWKPSSPTGKGGLDNIVSSTGTTATISSFYWNNP